MISISTWAWLFGCILRPSQLFTMARITDLPNEVLLMIVKRLLPDDIESATLACGAVYRASQRILEQHRRLKDEFEFYRAMNVGEGRTLIDLAIRVVLEPEVAFYIKKLELCAKFSQKLADDKEAFNRISSNIKLFATRRELRQWRGSFLEGQNEGFVPMFLLILPNLKELRLGPASTCYEIFKPTIHRDPRPDLVKMRISNLEHVYVGNDSQAGGHRLDLITTFARLSSVHSIEATRVIETEGYWRMPEPCSLELRTLKLRNCQIPPKIMFDFLRAFKALQKFSSDAKSVDDDIGEIACPHENDGSGGFIEPYWARLALELFAKDTLERLTLRSRSLKSADMGDITSFPRLQYLNTEISTLFPRVRRTTSGGYWYLAALLPPSIEHVRLHNISRDKRVQASLLALGLLETKTERVPFLKMLELFSFEGVAAFEKENDWCGPSYEDLQAQCEDIGFSFTVTAYKASASSSLKSEHDGEIGNEWNRWKHLTVIWWSKDSARGPPKKYWSREDCMWVLYWGVCGPWGWGG